MRKSATTNTHDIFSLLLLIVILIPSCESNQNINDNILGQQDLPQYRREGNPPPASSDGPRLIGLELRGRVKSLLWNNPITSVDSNILPLFSSSYEYGDIKDKGQYYRRNTNITKTPGNVKEYTKKLRLPLFLPSSVYSTVDYHFRKNRWYGVERIGTILRWNYPRSRSHFDENDDEDGNEDFSSNRKRFFGSPTTLDITGYHSLSNPLKAGAHEDFISIIDSGDLRIGWQQEDDGDSAGDSGVNPWIQIGIEPKYSESDDFVVNNTERNVYPFYFRFFLPLIRKRFDLQWTSRWGDLPNDLWYDLNTGRENKMANRWSSKHMRSNGDPWWIPQVSLDPSLGIVTSINQYQKTILGGNNRRYLTEFRFRLRATMPTILSSVTNNAIATYDDDDLEAASLRFECSSLMDLGEKMRPSLGVQRTTARFETLIVPSFWLRSMAETARFGLIHEQVHVKNN